MFPSHLSQLGFDSTFVYDYSQLSRPNSKKRVLQIIYNSSNKRGGPNKGAGWAAFFVYCMENSGEDEQVFRLSYEKSRESGQIFIDQ